MHHLAIRFTDLEEIIEHRVLKKQIEGDGFNIVCNGQVYDMWIDTLQSTIQFGRLIWERNGRSKRGVIAVIKSVNSLNSYDSYSVPEVMKTPTFPKCARLGLSDATVLDFSWLLTTSVEDNIQMVLECLN